jgi:hypothetical protein
VRREAIVNSVEVLLHYFFQRLARRSVALPLRHS